MNINNHRNERSGWRKHNSSAKPLLEGLGFKNTKTSFLKEWLSNRIHHSCSVEGDEFPIKVCYDKYVGAFKTWADACYQVALIERKKGQ
jgi:hypothetical protein